MSLSTLGAFLSGIGSVLSATWYVRRMRRRADDECQKRFDAFREGVKLGRGQ